MTDKTYTCVVCDSRDVEIFIEIPQVPVYCNVLYSTREDALNAPRADMQLGFCRACGHIYNFAFDPDKLDYTQEYENSLHHSPRFQEYARSLAARLIERHDLYNKDIIEIGSGGGDFLKLLCEMGGNRGVGFDPSGAHDKKTNTDDERIAFIQDFYSEHYASYKADLICCRQVLEHIQFPRELLLTLRRSIGSRASTTVFFEVPDVMFTLRDLGIWDLIYEHPSYFSVASLAHSFSSCGFSVKHLTEAYEGQFLAIEASLLNEVEDSTSQNSEDLESLSHLVSRFAGRYRNKMEFWTSEVNRIECDGKRPVIWGAGSKGVTFSNILQLQDQVEYIIDISPDKQGEYVGGTGQRIMGPEFLKEYCPDTIFIMNPIYLEEIRQIVNDAGVSSKLTIV